MVRRLKKFAEDTGEYVMRPVKKFRDTPQYTYLHSIGIGFWVFLIVTFCLGFLFMFYIENFVSVVISGYGLIGIFFLTIVLEMVVQPVGPDLSLILGVLAGLNGWIVLLVVLAGAYLALYLSYLIGKKVGTPGIERIVGRKTYEKINWKSGGRWFMFIGAATPVPYIPYLCGSWDFGLKDTILYAALPRTIRLLVVLILTYFFGVELLNISIGS